MVSYAFFRYSGGKPVTCIHPLVFSHFEDLFCSLRRLDQLLDNGIVIDTRINNMVPGQPESVISEYTRLPEAIIRSFHTLILRVRASFGDRSLGATYTPGGL